MSIEQINSIIESLDTIASYISSLMSLVGVLVGISLFNMLRR